MQLFCMMQKLKYSYTYPFRTVFICNVPFFPRYQHYYCSPHLPVSR
jgi:hypothetical protein